MGDKPKANDLFLLMLNLSQVSLKEKIIDIFLAAITEIWPDITASFTASHVENDHNCLGIYTAGSHYGFLRIDHFSELQKEDQALLLNACGLLAIIFKKNEQERLLADENLHLQKLVSERTEHLNAEIQDRKRVETQLVQAQKMESIGRLAGGVAHDYNNALGVIIGFTEMAMDDADPAGGLHANLEEILKAARRATDITRQLLAFARKQTIAPRVFDLNSKVETTLKMLRRLIGEDVDLAWHQGKSRWHVNMDFSQVDQILANLCVNARDAIVGVGNITIETGEVAFDDAYCADHAGFIPGEFVMLAVSDDGCGMDKKLLDHIFEPFFTTKEVDKGTGLGLSTVYGIVKQNNGFINVYSEPGSGTAIRVYLPRHQGRPVEIREESPGEIPSGHGETILLVEDDLSILELTRRILHGLGYTVLAGSTPVEAIKLAEQTSGGIDLLLTDVIMPQMNGRELSERLQFLYPDLKCLFMSGYTADAIAHHGVLEDDIHFIQKPFSRGDLATIVRKVLDAP
jgi:two-component system, cell cycle sensor histidine kinase and response regulator CckA